MIPWYRRTLVGMEVGPTGAQSGVDPEDAEYVGRFSGREIVEAAIAANAEYLVIWAKDGEFAYYDSQIAPKAPGLGERDVLRECVETAAPHGLPVIAYCCIQYDSHVWRLHPEWRMKDAEGKDIGGRLCLNSAYLDYCKRIAAEMLAYGIDGFHFDMLDQGFGPPYGCWNPASQARFEAEYGRPIPQKLTWDAEGERLLEFRYNTSARFEREFREFVRSQNPAVTVDFNYHGAPPCSWEVGQRPAQHAHLGDFATGECGLWAFGALHTSLAALFLAATKPGAVYQVVMQRGARTYHDMTTRPLIDMRWEALTLLSHGAQVTVVDKTPYDGSLDRVTYERVGAVFAEARRKREHFGHRPLQEVGLYYSSRSRDWYGQAEPDRYQRAFLGAHRALTYAHIPTGVLLDENVTADKLRQFTVVFLPNTAILTDHEVALLRDYVREGGNLLATGLTGLHGPLGQELAQEALTDLIGATLVEKLPNLDNHLRLEQAAGDCERLHLEIPLDWPFLVYGPAAAFAASTAESYGQLYRPQRTLRQRKGQQPVSLPMSPDRPVGPALLVNSYGKGKVIYAPCSPDFATASEYRTAEPRLLIRNLVRYLNPEPEVEVSAPLNVESVITEDEANRLLRIHLISYLTPAACTGPGRPHAPFVLPSLMEEAPLYRARIRLRRPFKSVRALDPSTQVTVLSDGVQLQVEDVHETVIVSY
jgi:hypothetical protein